MLILITVVLLVLGVKLTWGLLRFCGKLLGGIISLGFYLVVGIVAVAVFCLTKLFLPIAIIVAVLALLSGLRRRNG